MALVMVGICLVFIERGKLTTCHLVREVGTIIRALGVAPSELQLQQLVKLMEDPSRGSTGYISFHRFSDVVYNCMVNQQPFAIPKDDEERIFQAFRVSISVLCA